jgi:hypothetical protein
MQQAATARMREVAAISGDSPDSPERRAEHQRRKFSAGQLPPVAHSAAEKAAVYSNSITYRPRINC